MAKRSFINNNGVNKPENGGDFTLKLRDEDLATGSIETIRAKRSKQLPKDNLSSKKLYYTEKERKKEEREHRKRNRIKAGKNKRVFSLTWLAMVLLVAFTLASYLITGANDLLAVNREEGITDVTVPENVTSEQLAKILKENNIIDREDFFKLYCDFTAKNKIKYIKGGTYKVDTNLDYEHIISTLRSGDESREVVKVVFTEGMNILDIAKTMAENEVCTEKDFMTVLAEENFEEFEMIKDLKNIDEKYYLLEGYLFPDTYQFYKNENPKTALSKLLRNCRDKLEIVNQLLKNSGRSLEEVIVLASIIQREAANVNDMYMVSAVLHNRLERGAERDIFRLDCDSTIFYPYKTQADVPESAGENYTSSYNTYEISGLPMGAICNPGMDAIKAALLPSEEGSEYFYFCHSKDGVAYYAESAAQHQENLATAGLLKTEETAEEEYTEEGEAW